MSNVRADWQPVFLWPLPTDSSLPLSHSHQPIPIPTDLCPLPSSRILRALPPSGEPPRYSIFSLSFHSSFSPFLPPSLFRRSFTRWSYLSEEKQTPDVTRPTSPISPLLLQKNLEANSHTRIHRPRRHRRHILILHTKRYALSRVSNAFQSRKISFLKSFPPTRKGILL